MKQLLRQFPIAVSMALALALATLAAATHKPQTDSASPPKHSSHRKSSHRHHYSRHTHAQAAPTPDRISQIQSALAQNGYYRGDPNGKWDSETVAAMEKFQSANGLDATGKLDAPTLQKLGLGSDIAGVSAPKPIVPKCCATPSSQASSTAPSSTGKAASGSTEPTAAVQQTSKSSASASTPASSSASAASNSAVSDSKSPQH